VGKGKARNGQGTPPGNGQGEGSPEPKNGRGESSAADILAEIEHADRAPFRRLTAQYIEGAPTVKEIRSHAKKSPDRYMQGLTMAVKLAGGYEEKSPPAGTTNIAIFIHRLSDIEVMQRYAETQERLRALDEQRGTPLEQHGEPKAIEAETDAHEPHEAS